MGKVELVKQIETLKEQERLCREERQQLETTLRNIVYKRIMEAQ